ncbi:hypothetical protein [Klebsiella pneumoniae]|uniref:Uncharacterized protein n=1 Tax=Enterobacter cloacae TaxID=550 RepID=A0A0E3DSL1_ENTCL|nr:hypothetical protein [Klebsiella pneumoniae]AIM48471.1 hypothetical protein [Enterobacter cloacae]
MQPFISFIAGDGTPLTVTKTDEIWRVGENEIDSIIRKAGHDMDAITLDKSGHSSSPFSKRRQLRRADTTAGRKVENAGAVPQAAAQ